MARILTKSFKKFPKPQIKLHTEKGIGVFQKMDIFKGLMWYAYKNEWMTWHKLETEAVLKIIEKNKLKESVTSLEDYVAEPTEQGAPFFASGVGADSLSRFDRPKRGSFRRKKKTKQQNDSEKKA